MEPLTEKQKFWQQHVLRAQSSNGSLADYARQQQLNAKSLYHWVRVFNRTTRTTQASVAATGFSVVRVASPAPAHCQIHLSSRVMLQCSALPDPQWLAELCRQLDEAT
jgi:transposase-like protein